MLKGETGYGTYFRKGAYTLQAYAPIDGTDGWMVAVDAPVTDFLGSVVTGIIIGAAIGVIAVAYSIYKAKQIGQAYRGAGGTVHRQNTAVSTG